MAERLPDTVDLARFSLRDMTEVGAVLRRIGDGARSMEEVAGRVVSYLYDHIADAHTGERSCALVRFFKTHPFGELDEPLRRFAEGKLSGAELRPETKCLTLMASAGAMPEWCSRQSSRQHQAIPLPSPEILEDAPMIYRLLSQLGVEVSALLAPTPRILVDPERSSFNVFYVPEALGSAYIPAQEDFVIPHRIASVLGLGGMLTSGEIFCVILFATVPIGRETADLFRTLALNLKLAVMPFEEAVFA